LLLNPEEVKVDDYFAAEPYDNLAMRVPAAWRTVKRPFIFKFTLPVLEASELLRLLAKENITAASIYPSYDGVVQAMNETREWPDSNMWPRTPQAKAAGAYHQDLLPASASKSSPEGRQKKRPGA
jgi:hypothetical protein